MGSRFVFLGPPGAGKGTQANAVSVQIGVPAIATGSIFREAIAKNTTMGRAIEEFVNYGTLVPDKLTNAIVAERLKQKDCKKGFILNGYPRNLIQAKTLDDYLQKTKHPIDKVLYFKVDVAVVIDRLGQRRICNQCGIIYNLVSQPSQRESICDKCQGPVTQRVDDGPEALRRRLKAYDEVSSPLLAYYEKKGILTILNASLSVSEVAKQVTEICANGEV